MNIKNPNTNEAMVGIIISNTTTFTAKRLYYFKWKHLFKKTEGESMIDVKAVGKWTLHAKVLFNAKAQITVTFAPVSYTVPMIPIFVGPVSLIIQPFIQLKVMMVTEEYELILNENVTMTTQWQK